MDVEPKKSAPKRSSTRKSPPPKTPEAQEQRMINLSMKQAEKMLEEGRAPAQIVVHFLKLATEKAKLENEKLKAETEMAHSKSEVMQAQKHYDEIVTRAVEAFKRYGGGSGTFDDSDNDEEDYYDD